MTDATSVRENFTVASIRWLLGELMALGAKYYLGVISFLVTMVLFTQFFYVGLSVDKSFPDDHLYVTKKWDTQPVSGMKYAIESVSGPFGPGAGATLVKIIYGMPGDRVEIGGPDGRDVFINGEKVAHAKPYSKKGKPLTVTTGGVIPAGKVYVGTPSKDSYDSRYATMGLIPFERIKGRVITIF